MMLKLEIETLPADRPVDAGADGRRVRGTPGEGVDLDPCFSHAFRSRLALRRPCHVDLHVRVERHADHCLCGRMETDRSRSESTRTTPKRSSRNASPRRPGDDDLLRPRTDPASRGQRRLVRQLGLVARAAAEPIRSRTGRVAITTLLGHLGDQSHRGRQRLELVVRPQVGDRLVPARLALARLATSTLASASGHLRLGLVADVLGIGDDVVADPVVEPGAALGRLP